MLPHHMDKKRLFERVFHAQTAYVPLLVNVRMPEQPRASTPWLRMRDPSAALAHAVYGQSDSARVGSDFTPFVESGFVECLVPTLFGAQAYEAPGGYADVRPVFTGIEQAAQAQADPDGGLMGAALDHLRFLRANAPPEWLVCMSRFMSPLDNAVVLRGGEFYADLLESPELAGAFLNNIADVTLACMRRFLGVLGEEPRGSRLTVRGLWFPGLRLSGDAVVNLSPSVIRGIMFPLYRRFADEFGAVMLHYCCTPSPSGHVLPVLAEGCGITCVDNWQGYKTLFNERQDGLAQERVGICTDLPKEAVADPESLFTREPLFADVPREGGRPLTVSVGVSSVDEGRRLYNGWRDFFARKKWL